MSTNSGDLLNTGETKTEWRARLKAMTEDELYQHCEKYIWLSAYANNNPNSDFHFLCDAGYDECKTRSRVDVYDRAYRDACESCR
jgi:hypothetical protein